MKINLLSPKILSLIALVMFSLAAPCVVTGAVLEYNPGQNLGWFDATNTQWGTSPTYNQNWADGNTASFSTGATVSFQGSASLTGLTVLNSSAMTFQATTGSSNTMTFSGGNFTAGSGGVTIGNRVTITGDFTSSGTLTLGGDSNISAYAGTITVANSTGSLIVSNSARLGTSSNVTIAGGGSSHNVLFIASANMGALTLNSNGPVQGGGGVLFRGNINVSATSLSGGVLTALTANSTAGTNTSNLTVNQSTSTTYAGDIFGTAGDDALSVKKSGSGDLTLTGDITGMVKTTTVDGGRLYLSNAAGKTQTFGDNIGSTAIQVANGGTLGGTGTIITSAGDNVVVANGGKLAAGLVGTAGRTTYTLGTGASVDMSGVSSSTGWLLFDLGANTTAGTTYDQIKLTAGTLAIGSGILNFDDFAFTTLAGFGTGVYTLFDTTGISGSLGSSLSGTIGSFNGTLSQSGSNILLTVDVIPEPSTYLLLGFGVATLLIVRKRKSS